MNRFIETHAERFGVEPICRAMAIAPSSFYASRTRGPSARARRDEALRAQISRVHREHFDVYGVRKVWRQLGREGIVAGRDRVARLMRGLGLRGAVRERRVRTTRAITTDQQPADLVDRHFRAEAPDRLWVADLTYVPLAAGGFCYTALVTDAFARRIVGWRVAATLRTELALDALELALWTRRRTSLAGLVHHSDRGSQYLALRYTERLAEVGALPSVGTTADSYDNALAETVIGLYKAELIRRRGPWRSVERVELATAEWVSWWNTRRLHSACGDVPPDEFEAAYRQNLALRAGAAA
jgi:putative transposase